MLRASRTIPWTGRSLHPGRLTATCVPARPAQATGFGRNTCGTPARKRIHRFAGAFAGRGRSCPSIWRTGSPGPRERERQRKRKRHRCRKGVSGIASPCCLAGVLRLLRVQHDAEELRRPAECGFVGPVGGRRRMPPTGGSLVTAGSSAKRNTSPGNLFGSIVTHTETLQTGFDCGNKRSRVRSSAGALAIHTGTPCSPGLTSRGGSRSRRDPVGSSAERRAAEKI